MINWDEKLLAPLQRVFGQRINYRPKGKNEVAFDTEGIFDRPYSKEFETLDGSSEINTTSPIIGVRLSQFLREPKQGDRLFIYSDNTLYVVSDVQPDSHGGVKLILNVCK
ncbi:MULTISPECIES: head-tail joining protein [Serratia]|uniref:head-tail joining protein n=1 Tax=Serratia TaxID=613 RepID=UPI0009499A05|nr:hypothetical protein [Serratia sp. 506_PEND]